MNEICMVVYQFMKWAFVIGVSVTFLGWIFYKLLFCLNNVWKRTRSLGCVCMLLSGVIYGGSKGISTNNTSTDENIDLIDIGLSISNEVVEVSGEVKTNFVQAVLTITVTEDSVIPQPIWFRDSSYNAWTNITEIATWTTSQPVLDPELSMAGTNVYKWISTDWTNSYSHAQWYIGVDLPPIQVEVTDNDYIIIEEFNMTSKKVRIKFRISDELEYPEGTVIEVQRKTESGEWEVVDEMEAVPSGCYIWRGFAVGKRTTWRLHMAITQTEE